MSKLTLSIDSTVVARAKQYAGRRGVSVSKLVQAYLDTLAGKRDMDDEPPVLRQLRGTLKRADVTDYRDHLRAKHK